LACSARHLHRETEERQRETERDRMIFFSFFKTLVGKEVAIEMKNDVVITGILISVDQYLNVKLKQVNVVNSEAYPQLSSMKNCFIRGNSVR
jgi:U6 snRNA-associated Sm-like protein LSm2